MTAANYQAATTGAGQSLSQTERFNSERTDCGPSVDPSAGSFLQDPMPLLTNYDSMEMSNNIDQFWYVEKLTTLTQLYLELKLPLAGALRAAKADLQMLIYKPSEAVVQTPLAATGAKKNRLWNLVPTIWNLRAHQKSFTAPV